MNPRTIALLLLGAANMAAVPRSVAAQTLPRDSVAVAAPASSTVEPLFTARDAWVAAAFAAATIALTPLDQRIATRLQDSSTQANRFFQDAATGAEFVASPGAFIIGGTLYAVGRLGDFDRVADLGLHGTEAALLAVAVTGVLKGAAGRARPSVGSDFDARDFAFGRGFAKGDPYMSFPSGHTTTAFAAAAAVTSEASRWWPRSTWYVAPVMYGGATLVGLSRMYHNRHWATDVVIGAGIGTFSGLKVVRYSHGNPHNRIDRWLLSTSIVPDGNGGMVLAWTLPIR